MGSPMFCLALTRVVGKADARGRTKEIKSRKNAMKRTTTEVREAILEGETSKRGEERCYCR